jgi:hypothetical protein
MHVRPGIDHALAALLSQRGNFYVFCLPCNVPSSRRYHPYEMAIASHLQVLDLTSETKSATSTTFGADCDILCFSSSLLCWRHQ